MTAESQERTEEEIYGSPIGREIPAHCEIMGSDDVRIKLANDGIRAEASLTEQEARLFIARLIDELGEWGDFDAP